MSLSLGKGQMGTKQKSMIWAIVSSIKKCSLRNSTRRVMETYYKKFKKYSFADCKCQSEEQFAASITRLYHTIEKGLSYDNYRAGFGKENIEKLLVTLEQYVTKGFDTTTFFYETALSCLKEYIKKNKEHDYKQPELEKRASRLPGKANEYGGTIVVTAPIHPEGLTYEQLVTTRHSIRHFSTDPVDIALLEKAIRLAQYTPSACNRQGWKTRIVADKEKIKNILYNQNGNRGFGQEIDKLLVISADIRAQQKNREVFQVFIR